ncbi:MAG TPA: rhodanese-like domain-containing protein [Woeseiaceae bacterium]|nr:rhodanese-like domain-containing protein [Woeseiaceae bacterium]
MIDELSPGEFQRRRRSGELWQLLDVREPWEIAIASLDNTINIPLRDLPSRHTELDPATPVAVICHGGVRSAHAAGFLAAQGYPAVANIVGGIDAWSRDVDASVPRY